MFLIFFNYLFYEVLFIIYLFFYWIFLCRGGDGATTPCLWFKWTLLPTDPATQGAHPQRHARGWHERARREQRGQETNSEIGTKKMECTEW